MAAISIPGPPGPPGVPGQPGLASGVSKLFEDSAAKTKTSSGWLQNILTDEGKTLV